jgi:hypothetical protein
MSDNVIELVNEISEFSEISDYMNDEYLTEVLGLIVKLISQPDIPATAAIPLIIRLEAMSAKFAMQASYYTNVNKSDRAKKNLYYSIVDATRRLVDALKYTTKV